MHYSCFESNVTKMMPLSMFCILIIGFVQAIINLTLAFNASGVTLHWEDIGNDCASTEYNVTIRDNASTSVLIHNTSDTTIHINSSDLLKNVTYTYTVKRCQHCSISKPFTLGKNIVHS